MTDINQLMCDVHEDLWSAFENTEGEILDKEAEDILADLRECTGEYLDEDDNIMLGVINHWLDNI